MSEATDDAATPPVSRMRHYLADIFESAFFGTMTSIKSIGCSNGPARWFA